MKKGVKFKKIIPYSDEIMEDYIDNGMNISQISEKYDLHYSNLRRFIKEEVKKRGLEYVLETEYFNVEDFPFLKIGDTFQFSVRFKIWKVLAIKEKENEDVFELSPAQTTNKKRHWVNDILYKNGECPDEFEDY